MCSSDLPWVNALKAAAAFASVASTRKLFRERTSTDRMSYKGQSANVRSRPRDETDLFFVARNGPRRLHDRAVVSTRGAEVGALTAWDLSPNLTQVLRSSLPRLVATLDSTLPVNSGRRPWLARSEVAGIQLNSGTRFAPLRHRLVGARGSGFAFRRPE